MIYFVQGVAGGLVKIGYSEDATGRLPKMRTDSPVELRLLLVEPGDRETESEHHRFFKDLHVRGDWYWPGRELVAYCGAIPDPIVDKLLARAFESGQKTWKEEEDDEYVLARWMTAGDVAAYLAVSVRWVRDHTRSGEIPHLRVGKHVRYRLQTIEAWLQERLAGVPGASPR